MTTNDKYYKEKFTSIVNVLETNSAKLKVSGISIAGSRARQQQQSDSDEDIIIAVAKDPSKEEFYPKLMQVLKNNFQQWEVYSGDNYNVVHVRDPKTDGIFDLALRTEKEFDKQHGNDVKYRKRYL